MCKSKLLSFHVWRREMSCWNRKRPAAFFLQRTFLDSDKTKRLAIHTWKSDDNSIFKLWVNYNIFVIVSNFSITLPFFPREHLAFYYVVFFVGNKALFPKTHGGNGLVCPLLFPVNQCENDLGLERKWEFSL